MPRVDIRTCLNCRHFVSEASNKELLFTCECTDEEMEDKLKKKSNNNHGYKINKDYFFVIGRLKILNDKNAKICYEKNFTFPSECPYLLEQTMTQDIKGLIK